MSQLTLDAFEHPIVQPRNETREHFYLKIMGRYYLHSQYAYAVANEVCFMQWQQQDAYRSAWEELGEEGIWAKVEELRRITGHEDAGSALLQCLLWPTTRVIDVVGVSPRHYALGRKRAHPLRSHVGQELLSIGIEVKVSRGDFLSGYHDKACNLNYLATPPGLVKLDELPEHVGLLTYDRNCECSLRMRRRAVELPGRVVPLCATAAMRAIAFRLTSEWCHKATCYLPNPFEEEDR